MPFIKSDIAELAQVRRIGSTNEYEIVYTTNDAAYRVRAIDDGEDNVVISHLSKINSGLENQRRTVDIPANATSLALSQATETDPFLAVED